MPTNPVATFALPVNTVDNAAAYKAKIDGNSAVAQRIIDQFAPHQTATPAMTITVDAGYYFIGSVLTEVAEQTSGTITAPATGYNRIDRAVISATTGTLSIITGTPTTGAPSAPAITSGNLPVAQISLTSTTTTITNAIISDERCFNMLGQLASLNQPQTFTGGQRVGVTALTSSSGSIASNFATNNDFSHSFTEDTTLANPSNIVQGQSGCIFFTQNASTAYTLAFGSYWKFPNAIAPSITTTLSACDTLYYNVRSATFIEANLVQAFG